MSKVIYGGSAFARVTPVSNNTVPIVTSGTTVPVRASFTRPADTTAYLTNDYIGSVTTGGTAIVFSGCARVAAGSGWIVGASLVDEANQITPLQADLYLFTADSTNINDNSPCDINASVISKYVGAIRFIDSMVIDAGSGSAGKRAFESVIETPIAFQCAVGLTSLYGIMIARNAYIPISAESFSIQLYIEQN